MDMNDLKIEYAPVSELVPYANNAKLHDREQIEQIKKSIEDYGFNDPVAVWHNRDGEMEIVEGHGRVLALKELGASECPVIYLDRLTDEQRREYTLVHNKLTMNTGFDLDILKGEMEDLTDFDWEGFGFDVSVEDAFEDEEELEERYSLEVGKVIYEPKKTNHEVEDLYEVSERHFEIARSVENEELRKLLEARAYWFVEFNFAKIADYYAYQATEDEQSAMEAMGLVLLDRDGLIENGFSDLVG